VIKASREKIYRAFIDPKALAVWLAPDEMTGKVHKMKAEAGGGYEMSLFYSDEDEDHEGKTAQHEDRFTAKFTELVPSEKIVQTINFDTTDPELKGEMTMTTTLGDANGAVRVTIEFRNIPPGIDPEDNDEGTRQSLAKLAKYVE
jgi:uncharacterized protein YndB with AHSA1/START domain